MGRGRPIGEVVQPKSAPVWGVVQGTVLLVRDRTEDSAVAGRRRYLPPRSSLLRLQQLQPAVDHFDLLIRHDRVIRRLSPLGFQRLLLQLADHLVQAGAAGASDRLARPARPPDCQLQFELQGLLGQPGEFRPPGLESISACRNSSRRSKSPSPARPPFAPPLAPPGRPPGFPSSPG